MENDHRGKRISFEMCDRFGLSMRYSADRYNLPKDGFARLGRSKDMEGTVESLVDVGRERTMTSVSELGTSDQPRIIYSTISPEEIRRISIETYGFPNNIKCVLHHRGTNDVYRLSLPEQEFAFRISRVNLKSYSTLMAELSVLDHLRASGVDVAKPMPRSDGGWITDVSAPEGLRRAVIFRWERGSTLKYKSEQQTRQLGGLVARVHLALDDMSPQAALPDIDAEYLLRKPLDVIYPALAARRKSVIELKELADHLEEKLKFAHMDLRDWGMCHGDIGNYNALIDDQRCILFDFEFCGRGWRLFDLASYRLHARFEGFEKEAWYPFIQGYLTVRPVAQSYLRHTGLFMCLRRVWLAAKWIEHLAERGVGALSDTYYEKLVPVCREIELEVLERSRADL